VKIAIVGGGMAGLSAALELSEAGHQVSVLEKYPQMGGLASTVEVGGNHLERFYHHVFGTDLDILALVEKMGLWDKLKWYPPNNANWFGGRWYPFNGALDALKFPPLPLVDRLRMGVWAKYLSMASDWRGFEDVTATRWLTRKMGPKVYRVLWEPLLKAKFGDHAESISMAWFYSRIHSRFGPARKDVPSGRLGYLDGSVKVLVDAVETKLSAAGVALRTGQEVRCLVTEGGRVTGLETRKGFEPYDAVLATCATPLFLQLAGDSLPADLRESLGRFEYYGSCVAILELSQSLSPVYWMNVLDTTIPFLAVIEHTNLVPKEAYQGRVVMYLAKYLDVKDPFYALSPQEVLKEYLAQLKRVFPAFDEKMVLRSQVMRAEHTQPIVTPGYGRRIPPHRLPMKGLYLCNMTQIYPEDRGMSYSIGLGAKTAKMMMEDFKD
jgi:protoporphyrinogen oxidase